MKVTMMNQVISNIMEKRSDYKKLHNKIPKTVAVNYEDGVAILTNFRDTVSGHENFNNLTQLLKKNKREDIIKELNGMTLAGMKLTVVDIL